MICKRHGEIDDTTLSISRLIQPVIRQRNGKEIKLDLYDKGASFCLECLQEFLTKKIGVVVDTPENKKIG